MSLKKEYEDMKGAESSFSNTFEKSYFVDPIFFKNRRKYKIGRCSWENCTTKKIWW